MGDGNTKSCLSGEKTADHKRNTDVTVEGNINIHRLPILVFVLVCQDFCNEGRAMVQYDSNNLNKGPPDKPLSVYVCRGLFDH